MPLTFSCPSLPQLAQEARNIYQEFLSSQALSPVNIDRQAWLGEEVLAEPRPDMFRAQQLQVIGPRGRGLGKGRRLCRGLGGAEAGADPGAEPERQRWWGWGGEESRSGCWHSAKGRGRAWVRGKTRIYCKGRAEGRRLGQGGARGLPPKLAIQPSPRAGSGTLAAC